MTKSETSDLGAPHCEGLEARVRAGTKDVLRQRDDGDVVPVEEAPREVLDLHGRNGG